ncbi:2-hydroxy-6-oxo-6-phenylhexa-2,4-dienoate hydrolase [plant metagenome]|uniref:2-hydroxy-6-oxo-6-phenylhexa-2,4-dienoate hydrolase n=1 Tax=plant metagenome TaxID=1297885 RepID=A0A484SCW8_9ZZZZ
MIKLARIGLLGLSTLGLAAGALAQAPTPGTSPAYGPQLEGFDYPHPIQRHAFSSQGQQLEMAYMDVAPQGQANGRTVVLLHGKNFCGATWQDTIAALSQAGYRVVAPDQVGFCASSKPASYQFSFHQLAANTAGLLDALKIQRATVIGHSMGGMLATRFALMHPERTEKLVMVNPIGLEDYQAEGVPYATLDSAYEGELKTRYETLRGYQQKFYYDNQWKPEYDRWVHMLAGLYAGPGKEIVSRNAAQTGDMIFTQPVVHEFGNIRVPTTLIIGQTDRSAPGANRASKEIAARLGNYPELGRKTAQAIPGATLIEFQELGHSPQVEAPARFNGALLKDLAG